MMNPGIIRNSRIYYILAVHFNDYIMKTVFKIFMTCTALFLCACTPQTADKEQFSLSQTSFEVPAEGGRVEVTVRT